MLLTPPISAGGLRGITRGVVLEIAGEFGIPWSEPEMTRYDIFTADECFLTGTAAEISPGHLAGQAPHRRRCARAGDRPLHRPLPRVDTILRYANLLSRWEI